MNVLYIPQMSMYCKQTKKFLPMADGNINMMRNTINEWWIKRPDDKFFILLPKTKEFYPYGKFTELGLYDASPIYYEEYVVSARINRYNFPMSELSELLNMPDYKIDLIINDVIELAANFKQMFKIQFGYTPKIISNIRHVDELDKSDYIYNVIDGFYKSDLTTILSDSMKPKLKTQILEAGIDIKIANMITHNIVTFEPSISSYELLAKYTLMFKHSEKVVITFPGRISFGEENRTNWAKFVDAIFKLREVRQDFEVYFTDPNNCLTNINIAETNKDWIYTIPKDRLALMNLYAKTDVIVSLMDVEGFGGISIREALLYGCRPVIPYVHEYKKMASKSYPGFVESPIEIDDLVGALNYAINSGKKKYGYNEWTKAGEQFTVEEQFKKLLPKLEEIING